LFTHPYQNFELDKAGIHKSRVPGRPDDYILNGDVKCLWAVSMELASYNSGDVWKFQVILRLLENRCSVGRKYMRLHETVRCEHLWLFSKIRMVIPSTLRSGEF